MTITRVTVRVTGRVGSDTVRLELGASEIPFDSSGHFAVDAEISSDTRNLALTTVDAQGRRTTRTVQVHQNSAAIMKALA